MTFSDCLRDMVRQHRAMQESGDHMLSGWLGLAHRACKEAAGGGHEAVWVAEPHYKIRNAALEALASDGLQVDTRSDKGWWLVSWADEEAAK